MVSTGDEESVRKAFALLRKLTELNDDVKPDGKLKSGARRRACAAAGLDGSNFTKWEKMIKGQSEFQNVEVATLRKLEDAVSRALVGAGVSAPAAAGRTLPARAAALYREPASAVRDVFDSNKVAAAEFDEICAQIDEAATGQAVTTALARVVTRWWRAAHPLPSNDPDSQARDDVTAGRREAEREAPRFRGRRQG